MIQDFELIHHGIDYPDYFQGCGVAFTDFTCVVTGIGATIAEAIDDCLNQMESEGMESRIEEKYGPIPEGYECPEGAYHYVSIRWR